VLFKRRLREDDVATNAVSRIHSPPSVNKKDKKDRKKFKH
jgi:hypothetical protein